MNKFSVAVALFLLALTTAPTIASDDVASSDASPYPIWINPSTGVDVGSDPSILMEQSFWPDRPKERGFKFTKGHGRNQSVAFAKSCADIQRLRANGYRGPTINNTIQVMMAHEAQCKLLDDLQTMKSSTTSYLDEFELNDQAVELLPAFIDPGISCQSVCERYEANKRGIPLSNYSNITKIERRGPSHIGIATDSITLDITLLAKGDFDGDGIEDVYVRVTSHVLQGTWGATNTYKLTRLKLGAVLSVVDPRARLCPKYECNKEYPVLDLIEDRTRQLGMSLPLVEQ